MTATYPVFLLHAGVRTPKDITEPVLREYRLWLNSQEARPGQRTGPQHETLKKKTQNYYLIALRAFLKYLRKRHITSLEPESIELAKVGDRSLDLITEAELRRLLYCRRRSDRKGFAGQGDLAPTVLYRASCLGVVLTQCRPRPYPR